MRENACEIWFIRGPVEVDFENLRPIWASQKPVGMPCQSSSRGKAPRREVHQNKPRKDTEQA